MRFQGIVISALLVLTSIAQAFAGGDVYSAHDPGFVRVTKNEDRTTTFEYCYDGGGRNCRLLGNKQKYTTAQLQRMRRKLMSDAKTDVVRDSGFVIVGAVAGGLSAFAFANPVSATIIAIGAATGAATPGAMIVRSWLDPNGLNAYRRYWSARTLDDAVILDSWTAPITEPSEDFARRLDEALRQIW